MTPKVVLQRPTIPLDALVAYLFGAEPSALAVEVGPWLAASPRFRAFAETYRDKIRKKARGLRDDEGGRDLVFELWVASRLLEERRFTVEYESYGSAQRAPDFCVTFRTRVRFNVEVRRVRPGPTPDGLPDSGRLIRAICDKLRQLPPKTINVLVIGAGPSTVADGGLSAALLWLEERAARKDDVLFKHRGFAGTRDFLRHYHRLSGALSLPAAAAAFPLLWRNAQARHQLPDDLARALISAVT